MEFELDLAQIEDRIHYYLHQIYKDDIFIHLNECKGNPNQTKIKRLLKLENSYRFKIRVFYGNERIKVSDERISSKYVKNAIFFCFSSHMEEIQSKLICLELE